MKVLLAIALIASAVLAGSPPPTTAHWSFQPIQRPTVPSVTDTAWPRTDIDRFILAKLESHDLPPSTDAPTGTLIRRLCFALCGLPPAPETLAHWTPLIERDPTALAALADSLLNSPRYGEHWGQHWLDVARFAESTGGDANGVFPHAWRYRDYVIDQFNRDTPFDQFIRAQIAGDLLPIADDREWAGNLVATGFLAVGQKLVGEVDDRKFFADLVDEQIDATTRAFLGLTVACARCHDHKTDPIPQADYYALAAIFRNAETHYGLIKAQSRQFSTLLDVTGMGLPPGRDVLSRDELATLRAEQEAADQKMTDIMREIRSGTGVTRATLRRSRTQRDETDNALQSYDAEGHPLTFAMGVQERHVPLETRLLERGELDKPGPLVGPGFLTALAPAGLPADLRPRSDSPRRQLADWIATPRNPLTARVIANRVWHGLFGQGIVLSVDDFGLTGDAPSHPELLDHLAVRLVENQWSLKKLIREIVLTRTWQQSSTHRPTAFEIDPDNRLLWRINPRRLEGEAVRDAMLAVSGQLQLNRPAQPLLSTIGEGTIRQGVFEPEIRQIDAPLRSIYLPRVRAVLPEFLELYDAPDASNVCGARETTTVPLQALFTLNSPWAQQQAAAFAARIAQKPAAEQLDFAYLTALGRLPTAAERTLSQDYLTQLRLPLTDDPLLSPVTALTPFAHALLCTAEFTLID